MVYMVKEFHYRIMSYFAVAKKQPNHIVVIRDGVSEGEFQRVLDEELSAVKEVAGAAC
jgi:hypothetical protein